MEVQFLNWAKSYWSNWALGLKKRLRTKKELERKYREAARGEKEGEPAHLEEDDNEVGDRKVDEQKVHPGLALPCQPLPKTRNRMRVAIESDKGMKETSEIDLF